MKKNLLLLSLAFLFFGIQAQTYTAKFSSTFSGKVISLNVQVNQTTKKVTITESGPSGNYFAFGFNASRMSNTYAIIANSNNGVTQERKLAKDAAGNVLNASVTVLSNTTINGITTIVMERALAGPTADYYNFSNIAANTSVPIILAMGINKVFVDHGGSKGTGSLVFSLEDPTAIETSTEKTHNISVYPNPTKDNLSVTFDQVADNTTITVFDAQFHPVQTNSVANSSTFEVSLSDLPSGLYYVSVKNDIYSILEKVVKE